MPSLLAAHGRGVSSRTKKRLNFLEQLYVLTRADGAITLPIVCPKPETEKLSPRSCGNCGKFSSLQGQDFDEPVYLNATIARDRIKGGFIAPARLF
jgi:hypothetical protein